MVTYGATSGGVVSRAAWLTTRPSDEMSQGDVVSKAARVVCKGVLWFPMRSTVVVSYRVNGQKNTSCGSF